MEPHVGADLSGVKIHTGAESVAAARAAGAHAFTTGRDIHFDAGQFAPGTREGDRLLAHELTHVAQNQPGIQRKANPHADAPGEGHAVSQPGDESEKDADAVGAKTEAALHDGKAANGTAEKTAAGPVDATEAYAAYNDALATWQPALDSLDEQQIRKTGAAIIAAWNQLDAASQQKVADPTAPTNLFKASLDTGYKVGLRTCRGVVVGASVPEMPGLDMASFIEQHTEAAASVVSDVQKILSIGGPSLAKAQKDAAEGKPFAAIDDARSGGEEIHSESRTILGLLQQHPTVAEYQFMREVLKQQDLWQAIMSTGDPEAHAELAQLDTRVDEQAAIGEEKVSPETMQRIQDAADEVEHVIRGSSKNARDSELSDNSALGGDATIGLKELPQFQPPERAVLLKILDERGLLDPMLRACPDYSEDALLTLVHEAPGFESRTYEETNDLDEKRGAGQAAEQMLAGTPGAVFGWAAGVYTQLGSVLPGSLGQEMNKAAKAFQDLAVVADQACGVDDVALQRHWRTLAAQTAGQVDMILAQAMEGEGPEEAPSAAGEGEAGATAKSEGESAAPEGKGEGEGGGKTAVEEAKGAAQKASVLDGIGRDVVALYKECQSKFTVIDQVAIGIPSLLTELGAAQSMPDPRDRKEHYVAAVQDADGIFLAAIGALGGGNAGGGAATASGAGKGVGSTSSAAPAADAKHGALAAGGASAHQQLRQAATNFGQAMGGVVQGKTPAEVSALQGQAETAAAQFQQTATAAQESASPTLVTPDDGNEAAATAPAAPRQAQPPDEEPDVEGALTTARKAVLGELLSMLADAGKAVLTALHQTVVQVIEEKIKTDGRAEVAFDKTCGQDIAGVLDQHLKKDSSKIVALIVNHYTGELQRLDPGLASALMIAQSSVQTLVSSAWSEAIPSFSERLGPHIQKIIDEIGEKLAEQPDTAVETNQAAPGQE
jgi:hypothetical protein